MPFLSLPTGDFHLGLCTNVLPGTSLESLEDHLSVTLPELGRIYAEGREMGAGLWLGAPAVNELEAQPDRAERVAELARQASIIPFTLNGFPYGDFHSDRVKDDVFRPAWDQPDRREYTLALGRLLARWRGEGQVASISTLSGGFKGWGETEEFRRDCAANMLAVAAEFHRLHEETGCEIVLGLEPEPGSTLERTEETISFFEDRLFSRRALEHLGSLGIEASSRELVARRHLGVCFDACHQSVEFEDPVASLDSLSEAGVRLAKFQVTSALDVSQPNRSEARERLAAFAEPRYLHQVACRDEGGRVQVHPDLEDLLGSTPSPWSEAESWRIHFHVPVHREKVSGLSTTQSELRRALAHVVRRAYTPHIEVETYTWGVMPDELSVREGEGPPLQALAAELQWTEAVMRDAAGEVAP